MTPTTYLLHGDDEFALKAFIQAMQGKMGAPATASMNTTIVTARGYSSGDLKNIAYALPFLTPRRIVIVENVVESLKKKADQEKLIEILEGLPPSTALVLANHKPLSDNSWIVKWAAAHRERCYVRRFTLPKGAAMATWIRNYAREQGGEITPQAAGLLAEVVSEDPRAAVHETDKLLAYANYSRPVEPEDVDELTATVQQGDVFAMVDAIGERNGKTALGMLNRLLADRDALPLFGMIIRQFRLLLLVSEQLEAGATQSEIAKSLSLHPFVAGKIAAQSKNFTLDGLEAIYRKLLEVDSQIKTGKQDAAVALNTLIAVLTG